MLELVLNCFVLGTEFDPRRASAGGFIFLALRSLSCRPNLEAVIRSVDAARRRTGVPFSAYEHAPFGPGLQFPADAEYKALKAAMLEEIDKGKNMAEAVAGVK